jgi:ABC-type glycerol-3-phosphate transport system substrate-binding protein
MIGCSNSAGGADKKNGKSTEIKIKYWNAGLGDKWIENMIVGFEKAYSEYTVDLEKIASSTACTNTLGISDIDETDLYFSAKKYNTDGYLESLDDVLDSKADGESVTIREKFDDAYLKLETSRDGKVYNLTYGGGIVGIYYNKAMFKEQGIKVTPRTTDELVEVCDTLYSADIPAFCHFKDIGYWEDNMVPVFFTQYNGLDYVLNNFFGCTDEEGNSPSKKVFTTEDGRYEALKVFEGVITPEYTMEGSSSYDHTTVQTMWLTGDACMMVNGTWITSEMSSVSDMKDFALMRTPVISSIVNNLSTVKSDKELKAVISAIDSVTEGEKEESTYKQGDSYVVDELTVSEADWIAIRNARNTMSLNAAGNSAFIPTYSDNIDGAKQFLKYMYSDEGYKIYTETLQQTLPLTLSKGEVDMSKWTEIAQQQAHMFDTTEQYISLHNASAHDIFVYGGATWKGDIRAYCQRFCSQNSSDRWTSKEMWDKIVQNAEDNYENTWLANIE